MRAASCMQKIVRASLSSGVNSTDGSLQKQEIKQLYSAPTSLQTTIHGSLWQEIEQLYTLNWIINLKTVSSRNGVFYDALMSKWNGHLVG